jgi:hypothetical protein
MIQNLLLIFIVLLCTLLIISILRNPFDNIKNPCRFKILPPKFTVNGKNKKASFNIIVEKKHRYFINFPLLFKFYSHQNFKTSVKISYTLEEDESQILLNKVIEFTSKVNEHVVYITDVIVGKINIEIELEVDYGNPIIGFEIMQNSTCDLTKEHKLELKFPD